jgi:hypothetical protein
VQLVLQVHKAIEVPTGQQGLKGLQELQEQQDRKVPKD